MASNLDSSARQVLPKLSSVFGAKPGFVIPKNKIPASMLIRKNETSHAAGPKDKEDYTTKPPPPPPPRKTKWGSDLTSDPAVRKARALAYQSRVEQITKVLESGTLEIGRNDDSLHNAKGSSSDGANNQTENEGMVELLQLEKQEIIGEILQLNPGYKAPDDYKPLLKETKICLPTKAHPGHNIIGVLIGPERNTLKRLQEETGAKIRVYGTKKGNGEKSEILEPDVHEAQAAYEDLYIHVSADSYDKVDVTVSLIELLLTPVSVDLTDASETGTVAVTSGGVNSADGQQVQSTASQPGLLPYQSHNVHWPSSFQTIVPLTASSGPTPSILPNNTLQLQHPVGSFSVPPFTGHRPPMNFMPRNPLPVPGSQSSPLLNNQQPSHQFQANPSAGPTFGRPPGNAYNTQVMPPSTTALPVRPLQTPHASGGWPTFSPATVHSQRPSQGVPAFMPMRPISVSPLGSTPLLQGSVALVPSQSNLSTSYGAQHPPGANFGLSTTSHSRPSGAPQPFPSVSSSPAGASPQPPYQLSMQMRPPMSVPPQMRHPPSPFSQVGPTPGNSQLAHSSRPPASMPGLSSSGVASTSYSQTSVAALRPPCPATGDFTFRPHAPPLAASQVSAQANTSFSLTQAPSFRPASQSNTLPVQGFQRPPDGSFMGHLRMHAPPPHFPGAFPGNPSAPVGFRPPVIEQSNRMPSGPFHFLPSQQNPYPNANRQVSNPNPIYDPFVPTAVSGAKKADPG